MTADPRSAEARWLVPGLSLVLAVVAGVVAWLGTRDVVLALLVAGVLVVYAGVLVIGSHSETIRLLRGQTEDERGSAIEARASVASLYAVLAVVLPGAGVELFRGSPGPFTLVAAVGGLVYMVAIAVLRRRM